MGKRELVLVVGFVLLGVVVYQFTAPPPPPGSEGFSVGGLIRHIRRAKVPPRIRHRRWPFRPASRRSG